MAIFDGEVSAADERRNGEHHNTRRPKHTRLVGYFFFGHETPTREIPVLPPGRGRGLISSSPSERARIERPAVDATREHDKTRVAALWRETWSRVDCRTPTGPPPARYERRITSSAGRQRSSLTTEPRTGRHHSPVATNKKKKKAISVVFLLHDNLPASPTPDVNRRSPPSPYTV